MRAIAIDRDERLETVRELAERDRRVDRRHQAEGAPAHRGRQERRCRRRARRALSRVRRVAPREAHRVPRAARRRRAVGERSTTSRSCGTPRTSSASPTRCRSARSSRRCRRTSARSTRCPITRARVAASRGCTGPSCSARASAAKSLDQIAYEQLLREVDDGTFMRELQRDGVARAHDRRARRHVTLARLVETERRLVEGTRRADRRSDRCAQRSLAGRPLRRERDDRRHGRRRVVAGQHRAGRASCTIEIDPPRDVRASATNEVLIPGGRARLGGDPLSDREPTSRSSSNVPSFIIQRFPVTFASGSSSSRSCARRIPKLARALHAAHEHVERLGAGTSPRGGMITPRVRQQRCPCSASAPSRAEAYARVAVKEARAARGGCRRSSSGRRPGAAPTAASTRGAITSTRRSARCAIAARACRTPSRSARSSADVSPYGVRDLAGGVADWCIPDHRRTAPREPREVVSRGGAWCDWAIDCRLASRRRYLATEHSARVGVRLARDP